MDVRVRQNKREVLRLMDQLEVLSMSVPERRRLLADIGNQTRKKARENIRYQKTVSGESMAPRANSRHKKKLLKKMGKGMAVTVWKDNSHRATVSWKNPGRGQLAFKQANGVGDTWTPQRAAKVYGPKSRNDYKKPATQAQARSLNKEGYRRRVARKRGKGKAVLKRVPAKWIMDNMSKGQAGLILRLMRFKTRHGKQSWEVKPAPRPFLGATPEDADAFLTQMAEDGLKRVRRA
ncbi:hypothetical protein [Desulfoluna spongiiphila]|uniref:hypothetical protein n=1 Tax=Desulfoluna spongiiphila TaxID=419481 RepID=UPI00125440D0|nr:hypothetical protein [Desulfoluna spongiiphila]VVS92189.1 hypothetical protein DBB_17570 [Desulfoluna spongiiphila]